MLCFCHATSELSDTESFLGGLQTLIGVAKGQIPHLLEYFTICSEISARHNSPHVLVPLGKNSTILTQFKARMQIRSPATHKSCLLNSSSMHSYCKTLHNPKHLQFTSTLLSNYDLNLPVELQYLYLKGKAKKLYYF